MRRQEVLKLLGALPLLALRPSPAAAMGGTLPALDQLAPDFDLESAGQSGALGQRLQRDDFRGSWLVLYFYPRDFTSGCTLEARGFQRDLNLYKAADAAVVGVSADGSEKHASFCTSEGLDFPLLSDPGGAVSKLYGSWIPPFSQRHTFVIDPNGKLELIYRKVKAETMADQILSDLSLA